MSNDYFELETPLTRHTLGRAEQVNQLFQAVEAGFDKLPSPEVILEGRIVTDTGAADAYVVALDPAPTEYSTGLNFVMIAANANTGASTINVNGLGVKSIKRFNGAALSANDIVANMVVFLGYDGTNFRIIGTHGASETNAAASASAAASSATNAASSLTAFRGSFYGAQASDPTLDPNGNPVAEGGWYFNTTTNVARIYDGADWSDIGSTARLSTFVFTATGSETSLSGADDNANTLTYTQGLIQVHKNGALLTLGEDYTAEDGSTIADLSPLTVGDVVVVDAFSPLDMLNVDLPQPWVERSANVTVTHGARILATGSAFTVTLPAGPSVGHTVVVCDASGNAAAENKTIGRNGNKIMGLEEDMVLDVNGATAELVYSGATRGWVLVQR